MSTKSITRDIIISDPEAIRKLRTLNMEDNPKFKEILHTASNLKIKKVSRRRIQSIIKKIDDK